MTRRLYPDPGVFETTIGFSANGIYYGRGGGGGASYNGVLVPNGTTVNGTGGCGGGGNTGTFTFNTGIASELDEDARKRLASQLVLPSPIPIPIDMRAETRVANLDLEATDAPAAPKPTTRKIDL